MKMAKYVALSGNLRPQNWRSRLGFVNILYLENHAVFADQVTRQFLSAHHVTVVPSLAAARSLLANMGD